MPKLFLRLISYSDTPILKEPILINFRVTTPSVDSGNPSECSPMKTEPPCQEPDLEIEHVDNFETDLSTITQKITSLSK